jgi:hypothetical protein
MGKVIVATCPRCGKSTCYDAEGIGWEVIEFYCCGQAWQAVTESGEGDLRVSQALDRSRDE